MMPAYIGILSNKGKIIENDADALAYAFEQCGIEPSDGYANVDGQFAEMFREWFFSGDWIISPSMAEYLRQEGQAS